MNLKGLGLWPPTLFGNADCATATFGDVLRELHKTLLLKQFRLVLRFQHSERRHLFIVAFPILLSSVHSPASAFRLRSHGPYGDGALR